MIYSNGMGIKKNLHEGVKWLAMAADNNHIGARNSLAWIHATWPTQDFCNGKKAVALAESVVTLGQNPQYLDTLAAAYARVGRFDAAIEHEESAIKLATNPRIQKEFKHRLGLYQAHKTWPPTND